MEIPAAAQDEWLISPKFTVLDGQKLFFELQIDPSAIYMFDLSNHVYDRNTIASNLEVLASDDSGKTWKSLCITTEQIADTQTDDELYAQMAELKYRSISISVSEYAGKEIQVAFRYLNNYLNNPGEYGFSGNSMSVDAISVDTPTATSAYNLPSGSLLNGFTDNLIAYDAPLAIMPANTSIVWTSGANIYTENNTWNFYNHESGYLSTDCDWLSAEVRQNGNDCIISADGRILAKGIADSLGNATIDVSTGKGVFIVTTTRGNVRIIR